MTTYRWWGYATVGVIVSVVASLVVSSAIATRGGPTVVGLIAGTLVAGLMADVHGLKDWARMGGSVVIVQLVVGVAILLLAGFAR